MSDVVSIEQFMELQNEVREGFSSMKSKQSDLEHKLDMMMATMKDQNDSRYLQVKDNMAQAMLRLQDPTFRMRAAEIGNDWVKTDEARRHIRDVMVDCIQHGRDQATKWITFAKMIGVAVLAGGLGYIGISIIRSQEIILATIQNAIK